MSRVAWVIPAALVLGAFLGVPLSPWSTEGTSADISPPPTRIGAPAPPRRDRPDSQTGPPAQSPIEHLVVLMQENHTFDNYFGTYPGADGIPAGVCMPVNPQDTNDTRCVTPFHLEPGAHQLDEGDSTEGHIAPVDPDHSQSTFQAQYNNGRLDGFVYALNQRNQDGRIAMGYYDARDLPYYWAIADQYVLFDRFFSSASGGSVLNHFFWVAGASGGNQDRFARAGANDLPTIFDRLEQHGVSWKFYIQNFDANLTYRNANMYPGNRASQVTWAPVLAMDRFIDDPRLSSHLADLDQYYVDLQDGKLPAVAYSRPLGNQRTPARPNPVGTALRSLTRQRADPQQRLEELGVYVGVRRLGRLVRSRTAAAGGRIRVRLPCPSAARQSVRTPWVCGSYCAGLRLDPAIH